MKIWAIGGTARRSAIVAALAVTIPACGPASDDGAAPSVPHIRSSRALGTTRGPNGERPTPTSALRLSSSEVDKVRAGHHTAALVWHESSDFTSAVDVGVRDEFSMLGINVVAETSANFDAAKQKSDVETVQAKRPSVLLTLPVDPVVTASAYQAAARQGTKIVLLSSVPEGMKYGRDYVNLVTDDLFQMGKRAADALAAAIGGKGKIAYFFHDANHYVTNQRDQAFLSTITGNYPDIDVVAKSGIADPNRAQDIATATLLKHPDLAGAYVMFAQPPGEGVLAALRANGATKTKLVTLDLDEPLALDMARGGQTFALVIDRAYDVGRAMARSAAYGLLGKRAPPFVIVPALTITRSNLVQGYRASLHRSPPASVMKAPVQLPRQQSSASCKAPPVSQALAIHRLRASVSGAGKVEAGGDVQGGRDRQVHQPQADDDVQQPEGLLAHVGRLPPVGTHLDAELEAGEELGHVHQRQPGEQQADRPGTGAEEHRQAQHRDDDERDRHEPVGSGVGALQPVPAQREPVDAVGAEGQGGHVEGLVAGEDGEPGQSDEQKDPH
jgi:ribose transport system substrate-binding protein